MTTITPGTTGDHRRHTCPECQCVFDFTANDANEIYDETGTNRPGAVRYVILSCPHCASECSHYLGAVRFLNPDQWPITPLANAEVSHER